MRRPTMVAVFVFLAFMVASFGAPFRQRTINKVSKSDPAPLSAACGRCLRPRRIFYCINHRTLIRNEVSLLRSQGFEVYIPKQLPRDVAESNSAGVVNEFDATLTIPKKDLELLNGHNFYENAMSNELAAIVEAKFDIIITAYYPVPTSLFITQTTLTVGIRVFGLEGTLHYDQINPTLNDVIMGQKQRIVFLAAYAHLIDVETLFKPFFRFAPITFEPEGIYPPRNVTKKAVLFQCSRINVTPYYTAKARRFQANFNTTGLDYTMYGTDRSHFNDSKNLGRPTNDEVKQLMASYSALYYDSTEPRHLHYHPLEAMQAGMPVVFLAQGMLGRHLPWSPGKSANVQEAKATLKRLLRGDDRLEKEIRWHQDMYLNTLRIPWNVATWKKLLDELMPCY